MTVHAYTSFSYSYLNRARVLGESIKRHHPDWIVWAVITDKSPIGFEFDTEKEPYDQVITAEDLYGEETDQWLFKHDIVEACTAVKGRALERIMNEPGAKRVVYFDPDIAVFHPLETVVDALETYSIVLTPHQLTPDNKRMAIVDNEITSLGFGVFNLGFVAVRVDDEARDFAAWWRARLDTFCYDRRDIGLFVDQKWCNLVPCFFDSVKVLRDPGCNVASWNLSQRKITIGSDGLIMSNGEPLKFYHFTKLGPVGDTMTQRYAQDNLEVYELWTWYRNEVQRNTDPSIPQGWWYYGTFRDGTSIPKQVRELYRDREDLLEKFPEPAGSRFQEWLQENTDMLA